MGLALGLADGEALAVSEAELEGVGLALAAGLLSSPHAPRASRTALRPRPTRALVRGTGRFRTERGYRGESVDPDRRRCAVSVSPCSRGTSAPASGPLQGGAAGRSGWAPAGR